MCIESVGNFLESLHPRRKELAARNEFRQRLLKEAEELYNKLSEYTSTRSDIAGWVETKLSELRTYTLEIVNGEELHMRPWVQSLETGWNEAVHSAAKGIRQLLDYGQSHELLALAPLVGSSGNHKFSTGGTSRRKGAGVASRAY